MLELLQVRKPDGSPLPASWLERHFGIRSRAFDFDFARKRKRAPEEGGLYDSHLVIEAARRALHDADTDPACIGSFIHVSATPDYAIFQNHMVEIAQGLGLPTHCNFVHLNLGCPALATAFPLVHGELLRLGGGGKVLLAASQCTSALAHSPEVIQRYTCARNPWAWLSAAVFSDASAAAVFSLCAPGERRGIVHTHAQRVPDRRPLVRKYGGARYPLTQDNLVRDIVEMDAAWVAEQFTPCMQAMYAQLERDWPHKVEPVVGAPFDPARIDTWFFHQANLRKIEEAALALRIPGHKVPTHVAWLGNASGPSTLMLLDDARRSGRLRQGALSVFFWIGGGNGAQCGYSVLAH